MSNLQKKFKTKSEWLQARTNSVGASDIGTIMGLNKYMSVAELWGEKVKILTRNTMISQPILWGNIMESHIAEMYKTAVFDQNGELDATATQNNTKRVRWIHNPGHTLYYQSEYPRFTATPDRFIRELGMIGKGVVEIKTLGVLESGDWEASVPPQYATQLQWQMLCTGCQWGKLVILKGGNYLQVFHVERDQELIDLLIDKATQFLHWVDNSIEPEPEGTPAYTEYLKKRYPDNGDVLNMHQVAIMGCEEEYTTVQELLEPLKLQQEKVKKEDSNLLEITNTIRRSIGGNGGFLYENGSRVTNLADKNGKKTLRIS
jgi:predicted phage-related endonuclease